MNRKKVRHISMEIKKFYVSQTQIKINAKKAETKNTLEIT